MLLNLNSCSSIFFSLKKTPIILNYSLENVIVLRVSSVPDLGVRFDSKLSNNDHVRFINNKASAKLGLLKRA